MQAGKLRHRIVIQEKSVTRDEYNAEVITWTEVDTVWASVEPLSGREFLEGRLVEATVSHRITIRYLSGITPEMRVLWGSRVFDVEAILNIEERDKMMVLMCQEEVS
jgi:SPP1 family predicted phage head-tail adaptor